MILKARELEKLNETLEQLLPLQLKMPFAYKLACIARETRENNAMIQTMRQEIIERYAKRDAEGSMIFDGNKIKIDETKIGKLNKELDNLYNREIELKSSKIDLVDIQDLDLTVGQIEILIPLINE